MSSILEAARANKVCVIESLICGRISQEELNGALVVAVKFKNIECVQALLTGGAHSESADSSGRILKLAAVSGEVEIVKLLIEHGASVDIQDNGGSTALHHASRSGNSECVQALIQANASLNIANNQGCTPLISAAKNCHRTHRVMRRLCDAGCNIDQQDESGRTALHYCSHMAMGVDGLLEAGANPNIQDQEGNTPIHLAATEGFDRVIEKLVENNADPDIPNSFGKTALHYLAMKNHVKGINVIAEWGGNVNLVDGSHQLPLWYAVSHNRPGAVKALLRANSHTDPVCDSENNPRGGIPLQTALIKKLYGIAKLLILAGCDLRPLHCWMDIVMNDRKQQQAERDEQQRFGIFPVEQESEEVDVELEEALDWFMDWIHQPHSLRQLCRIHLRRVLGSTLSRNLDSIPLPQSLIDYVSLKEVEDHHLQGYWEKRPT